MQRLASDYETFCSGTLPFPIAWGATKKQKKKIKYTKKNRVKSQVLGAVVRICLVYIQLVRWYFLGFRNLTTGGYVRPPPLSPMYTSYSSCGQRAEKFGALTDMGMVRMPVNAFGFFLLTTYRSCMERTLRKSCFFGHFGRTKGHGGAH